MKANPNDKKTQCALYPYCTERKPPTAHRSLCVSCVDEFKHSGDTQTEFISRRRAEEEALTKK